MTGVLEKSTKKYFAKGTDSPTLTKSEQAEVSLLKEILEDNNLTPAQKASLVAEMAPFASKKAQKIIEAFVNQPPSKIPATPGSSGSSQVYSNPQPWKTEEEEEPT